MSVVLTHRDQQINSNHSPQNEISEMSKGILTPAPEQSSKNYTSKHLSASCLVRVFIRFEVQRTMVL